MLLGTTSIVSSSARSFVDDMDVSSTTTEFDVTQLSVFMAGIWTLLYQNPTSLSDVERDVLTTTLDAALRFHLTVIAVTVLHIRAEDLVPMWLLCAQGLSYITALVIAANLFNRSERFPTSTGQQPPHDAENPPQQNRPQWELTADDFANKPFLLDDDPDTNLIIVWCNDRLTTLRSMVDQRAGDPLAQQVIDPARAS